MKRKLKLLFTTFALIVGGQSSVSADPVGVTVQTGTYYLYNVGAKKYMTVGQIWGSRANVSESEAIPVQLAAGSASGTFKIVAKVAGDATGLFIDGTPAPYLDNGSPIDLTFEKQGQDEIYKIKDGSSRYIKWDGTNDALIAGAAEASGDNDKWIITTEENMEAELISRMGSATNENPVNVTLLIKSARPAWGTSRFWPYTNWTNGNAENADDRNSSGSAAVMGFWGITDKDIYQTIEVPKGRYKVRCLGYARAGDWSSNYCWEHRNDQHSVVYISSGENSGESVLPSIFEGAQTSKLGVGSESEYNLDGGINKYIPNNPAAAATYFSNHKYTTWAEASTIVKNGTVRIGVRNTSTQYEWVEVSQFELLYLEPVISINAVDLPANGSMTAGKWYKYTVTVTGKYTISATTTADIIQTIDGDQLLTAATGSDLVTGGNVDLTEGDVIYYKSSTANTLTIEANDKTYTVGDVTATSIADNTYLQSFTTVTFTLGDATTNDGTAALAIQGEAVATLNDGSSNVATGTLSVDGTVVTATFAYAIQPAKTYKITLPANAVAWDKNTTNKNTEKVITFKTPAVFDGIYYIKQNDADKYVSRGGDDNTEAIFDNYGIPVQLVTYNTNVTLIKFLDTKQYLGGGSSAFWTDKEVAYEHNNFTITKSGDNYTLYLGSKTKYMKAGTTKPEYSDDAYSWTIEAPAAHPAKLQAVKDAQASAAATAAGISASTQTALATYLNANKGETPIDIIGVANVSEQYQKSAAKGTGTVKKFFSETKTGLKAGLYRVRVNAFERIASLNTVLDAGGAAGLAYVYANDQKVQLATIAGVYKATAWSDGTPGDVSKTEGFYVNNTKSADAAFAAGYYVNDVYIYLPVDGDIEFGIATTNSYGNNSEDEIKNSQWICYNNFSLVKFDAKATDEEKTALAGAITAAEAKTLGFETGEYAPYNNVAALEALAAAKAIVPATASDVAVVAATTALAGATWIANPAEVNAVYDGTFAAATNDGAPAGWTMSNNTLGGSYHSRAFVGDDRLSEFNSTKSGLFIRFDDTNSSRGSLYYYGNTPGYTMPLKASTKYSVKVDFTNWGTTDEKPLRLNVTGPAGFSEKYLTVNSTKNADSGTDIPDHIIITFTTAEAGNYVLTFQCPGDDANKHNNIISNIELFKGSAANMTITDAKWATFCAPFDVAIPDGVTAYTVTGVTGTALTKAAVATTIPANTPVLLNSESVVDQTFYGEAVAGTPTVGKLTGVYVDTPAEAGWYVLQKQGDDVNFYLVDDVFPTVGANRAYLTLSGGAKMLTFTDDDEATGIANIKNGKAGNNAVYNISGQRVDANYKGVVIKNGKKIYQK